MHKIRVQPYYYYNNITRASSDIILLGIGTLKIPSNFHFKKKMYTIIIIILNGYNNICRVIFLTFIISKLLAFFKIFYFIL